MMNLTKISDPSEASIGQAEQFFFSERDKIKIEEKAFNLVMNRRNGTRLLISEDGDTYLRIGPPNAINMEIGLHKSFADLGFPVPKICSTGNIDNYDYFIEESVGQHNYGQIFADDYAKNHLLSEYSFRPFLNVLQRLVEAEASEMKPISNWPALRLTVKIDQLKLDKPEWGPALERLWECCVSELRCSSWVLNHGDLTAYNVFPRGIIDFEEAGLMPFGYDIAVMLSNPFWFPAASEVTAESQREFQFSMPQIEQLSQILRPYFSNPGSAPLPNILTSLMLIRGVWACVDLDSEPILKAYRYAKMAKILESFTDAPKIEDKKKIYSDFVECKSRLLA